MNFEKILGHDAPRTPDAPARHELKNTVELSTENADYLLYYTRHDVQTSPEIVPAADAVILESITDLSSDKRTKETVSRALFQKDRAYHEVVRAAAEQGKPIFLLDLSLKTAKNQDMMPAQNGEKDEMAENDLRLMIAETLGMGAIIWAASDLKKAFTDNPQMSRRNFFKFLGKTAAGAALASPLIGSMSGYLSASGPKGEPDESSVARKIQKTIEDANYHAHLGRSKVIHARNDLWAQKSETVAKLLEKDLGRKPKLAMSMGADHVGIERSLKDSGTNRLGRLAENFGADFKQEGLIAKINLTPEKGSDRIKVEVTIIRDENFK
ncbi:hypothetical protein HGA34_01750 [Candidatus Falkowbacteria bacterium]|nr:hypothetical protein [Candidatus Falkowbacteria bacterium]